MLLAILAAAVVPLIQDAAQRPRLADSEALSELSLAADECLAAAAAGTVANWPPPESGEEVAITIPAREPAEAKTVLARSSPSLQQELPGLGRRDVDEGPRSAWIIFRRGETEVARWIRLEPRPRRERTP